MWPFRRGRDDGDAAAAAVEEVAPSEPAGWETLPAIPATVGPPESTFKIGAAVKDDLVSLRSPRLSSGLGHGFSPDGPVGVVTNLVTPTAHVQRHGPPLPVIPTLPRRNGTAASPVQRQSLSFTEAPVQPQAPSLADAMSPTPPVQRQTESSAEAADAADVTSPTPPVQLQPLSLAEAASPTPPVQRQSLSLAEAASPTPVKALVGAEVPVQRESLSLSGGASAPVEAAGTPSPVPRQAAPTSPAEARSLPSAATAQLPVLPVARILAVDTSFTPPPRPTAAPDPGPAPRLLPLVDDTPRPQLAPASEISDDVAVPEAGPVVEPPPAPEPAPSPSVEDMAPVEETAPAVVQRVSDELPIRQRPRPSRTPTTATAPVQRSIEPVPELPSSPTSSPPEPNMPIQRLPGPESPSEPAVPAVESGPVPGQLSDPSPAEVDVGEMPVQRLPSIESGDVGEMRGQRVPVIEAGRVSGRLPDVSGMPVQRMPVVGAGLVSGQLSGGVPARGETAVQRWAGEVASPRPLVGRSSGESMGRRSLPLQRRVVTAEVGGVQAVRQATGSVVAPSVAPLPLVLQRRGEASVRFEDLPVARQAAPAPVPEPQPEPAPAPAPVASPPPVTEVVATPAPPAPAPAPVGAAATGDLDELARKLYDRIRWRLRSELRLDLERAGLAAGLRR